MRDSYTSTHSGLTGCDKNSDFPLALEKKTFSQISEDQSLYDYPLLRSGQVRSRATVGGTLDSKYAFRFNETTDVLFEVDSNFLTSHISVELSATTGAGVAA